MVTLPLVQGFFSCVAETEVPSSLLPPDPGEEDQERPITAPKKVQDVQPIYPPSARSQRRQGIVILEALISPTGCVRSVEVLRGPAPDLEGAALRAVTFWRYTPALLAGKPVPVVMTVTVNFRLQ